MSVHGNYVDTRMEVGLVSALSLEVLSAKKVERQ